MINAQLNLLAEAEAHTLRDIHGEAAEDYCIEAYMALGEGDPRRRCLNRVLAFLAWTERNPDLAHAA